MTTIEQQPAPAAPKRVIKVGPDLIEAARLREQMDKILGRPTSPVIAKIARARRPSHQA